MFFNCYQTLLGIIVLAGILLTEAINTIDLSNSCVIVQLRSERGGEGICTFCFKKREFSNNSLISR